MDSYLIENYTTSPYFHIVMVTCTCSCFSFLKTKTLKGQLLLEPVRQFEFTSAQHAKCRFPTDHI